MNDYYPEGFKKDINICESKLMNLSVLIKAKEENRILESRVIMCDSERNMTVELGGIRGIIPREEGAIGIKEGVTKDIALISRVGRTVCFVVTDITNDKNGKLFALLSRKKAQEMCIEDKLSKLDIGDIIDAKITHLESFGAFCDIGCGNIALMPIDLISVSRISHPSDRFFVGQNIKAIIKNIDENNRITLSHKELLGSWEENIENFSVGQTVSGIIRSIEEYGVFVELAPNLAGLAEPKSDVKIGQRVSVYIKNIIPERMKVKLVIIDTFEQGTRPKLKYFYEGEKIEEFNYSPEQSEKQIFTKFY
ncbi:MAG: S1 RNA-binding domain-containing protein [Clostridia bacterium]|nr:S1 RNA-binding domain-containing protein [Clostridia bacterium]